LSSIFSKFITSKTLPPPTIQTNGVPLAAVGKFGIHYRVSHTTADKCIFIFGCSRFRKWHSLGFLAFDNKQIWLFQSRSPLRVGCIHLQSCCMLPEALRPQARVRERAQKKAHPDWFCTQCRPTYPRPMNFKNINSRSIKYRIFDNTLLRSNRLFGCSSTLNLSNSAINSSLSNVAKFFFFIYL